MKEEDKIMNIYALPGHKVRCLSTKHPVMAIQYIAQKYLKGGHEYTIDRTIVHGFGTEVYLQGFPGVKFNPSLFVDVKPQSPQDDKKHPCWHIYNR